MNYIYFNEKGALKKRNIQDLYQGSHLVDAIYIFADFDTKEPSPYEVTLSFKRQDGFIIGPVSCLAGQEINPITGELMRCFSFLMDRDVLAVAGDINITASYHYTVVDPITGLEEDATKATALVTATVYPSIITSSSGSTALLNLNRKINTVQESLNKHINVFNEHKHNDLYYQKEESDGNYGNKLEVDSAGNILLFNAKGTMLSSVKVPTVIQQTPPGTLVFNGTGEFLFTEDKKYLISLIGSPTIQMGVFVGIKGTGMNEDEVEYEYAGTVDVESININILVELTDISNFYEDAIDGGYCVDLSYKIDGITKSKKGWFTPSTDWPTFQVFGRVKLGLKSNGYYQVYEIN